MNVPSGPAPVVPCVVVAAEGRGRPNTGVGALLRRFRGTAGLSQEELAERAGLSVQAVSAIERGVSRRPHPQTLRSLGSALGLSAAQRALLLEAAADSRALVEGDPTPDAAGRLVEAEALLATAPTDALPPAGPLPTGSRMPLAANPLFVGRDGEIRLVAAALSAGDSTVALGQVVASTGLGGLGKTQLAVELVHRYGRFFAGGVFWLSFASADEVPLQVAACAGSGAAGLEADLSSRPLEERVQLVMAAWQSPVPRLLVFDNCEEESLLERWRPTSGGCRVLVTSRRSHWSPTLGVTALALDLLRRPDSVQLVRRYRPDLAADDPRLDAIADRLGDLPLALHLAGRYLLAYRAEVSLDDYRTELDQPALIHHASLLGEGLDDSPSPTHHVQSLAQTFAICLSRLDQGREVDRVAIALLARMACMAPAEAVPRELLGRTLEDVGARLRADGQRRLAAVGLVEEGDAWLRMHRLLVHFVRQEALDKGAQRAVAAALIACGEDAAQGHLTGSALVAVIPHVVEVAGSVSVDRCDERLAAEVSTAAGQALQHAGDLRAARPWYERAMTIRERVLGPDRPGTADDLNNLALLLSQQGELAAARPLHERALAIRERALGPDHPVTAEALNNLAMVLWQQGDLVASRSIHERALAIHERVQGPDHYETAISLNNLGLVLGDQGEWTDARPLFERALAIFEQVLGPNHPRTVRCVQNLAPVLSAQGELDDARLLLERALAVREQVLGPNHPDTATSLNGLARVLHEQGELDGARPLLERALAIRERTLGPDQPRTAISLNDLALLLRDQGDPAAARPLFERALAIRERVLGPDHRDTVTTRGALAELAAEGDKVNGPSPESDLRGD